MIVRFCRMMALVAVAAASATVNADVQVQLGHGKMASMRSNGVELLAGNGIYLIGSRFGNDDPTTNFRSYGSTNGKMINDLGQSLTGFDLNFAQVGANRIAFNAHIAPVPYRMKTMSMPFDFRKIRVGKFNAKTSSWIDECEGGRTFNRSGGRYSEIDRCHSVPGGMVGVAIVNGAPKWGEVTGDFGRLRVTITASTHYKNLRFHRHPLTHNLELGFGTLNAGESAYVEGYIEVFPAGGTSGGGASSSTLTFQSESAGMGHQTGYKVSGAWATDVTRPHNKYLVYGPYTTSIPAGNHTAKYRLMLDNVSADNNRILTIDVYDANRGQILASKKIRRGDFSSPFTYKDFNLSFTSGNNSKLEFRTYYHGGSYVQQDFVSVN